LERCFIFSNVGKNLHKVVTSTINHYFQTNWHINTMKIQQSSKTAVHNIHLNMFRIWWTASTNQANHRKRQDNNFFQFLHLLRSLPVSGRKWTDQSCFCNHEKILMLNAFLRKDVQISLNCLWYLHKVHDFWLN